MQYVTVHPWAWSPDNPVCVEGMKQITAITAFFEMMSERSDAFPLNERNVLCLIQVG